MNSSSRERSSDDELDSEADPYSDETSLYKLFCNWNKDKSDDMILGHPGVVHSSSTDKPSSTCTSLTSRKRSFDDEQYMHTSSHKIGGILSRRRMQMLVNRIKTDDLRDGYSWRKYGQKDVLNSSYPRSYYRCAYKHTHGCKATKQVQRDSDERDSYYNITYYGVHNCSSNTPFIPLKYLERCLSYCLLFPPGYEFERDSLVQLWIAEEVIDGEATERLEEKGYACFQLLLSHKIIEPSGIQKKDDHFKYKVNKHSVSEHYAFRESLADEFMIISKDGFSNISGTPRHLSLPAERFNCQIPVLQQMSSKLRTLLLLGDSNYLVKQVPRDLFLSLNLLRTLVLSGTQVSVLPTSVGNLEDLRYFDLSSTLLRELPGVICHLVRLQTVKLRDCSKFDALPKGMMNLINLRHLDLDIVHQLSSMPRGMGRLVNLQTFKGFIVGTDEDCGIGELCQLNNITGSFCISCLENVPNVEEAMKADLRSKSYITKLVLRWEECLNAEAEQEILECLLPHPNLSELQIQFFSGSALPSWLSDSLFTNLLSITLYRCINCSFLPSIGNLQSLKFLNILGMDKMMDIDCLFSIDYQGSNYLPLFPMLEKLVIENMSQLEKWTVIRTDDFPCLHHLALRNFPRLVEIPSMSSLTSLKYLELNDFSKLECLPDMPASLETLIIQDCPKLKEQCRKEEGREWQKIAHVPNIWIQHRQISPISDSEDLDV